MALKLKRNFLLEKIPRIFQTFKKGSVLDLGCGWGMYSIELHNLGFDVTASDFDEKNFKFHDKIKFKQSNLLERLPFPDSSFDYLIFLETIEHLEKPFEIIQEIGRVIKQNGILVLSTPNILNLRSRMRFLIEGSFDFFREPPIDLQEKFIGTIENIHIIPWRYHELEYLLYRKGFAIQKAHTDHIDRKLFPLYVFLWPFLQIQRRSKERRSLEKGGLDYRRINNILFLDEMLFGRHLIVEAVNHKSVGQSFGHYIEKDVCKFDPSVK